MLPNVEGDVARALEYALRKASEPGETLPWGRLARRLAPSIANVVDCLMPFAVEPLSELQGQISSEMMEARDALRREIEAAVIQAIRERAFVPPPPLPKGSAPSPEG